MSGYTDGTIWTEKTVRDKAGLTSSGVLGTDTAIKATGGIVYWVSLSDTQPCVVGIANGGSPGTTYVWKTTIPADGYAHFIFDPPLECNTAIWLDMPTGTGDCVVGYI